MSVRRNNDVITALFVSWGVIDKSDVINTNKIVPFEHFIDTEHTNHR